MRIQEADETIRSNMVKLFARFVFPVYCTTSVEDFDYVFIGSGFFVKWDEKCVFVMTKHQYDLVVEDENIFVLFGDVKKGINVRTANGMAYEHADLVIFEVSGV